MTGTPFTRFTDLCQALTQTRSRDEKTRRVAALLTEVQPDEQAPTARFSAGHTLSRLDERTLDIGPSSLETPEARQASLTQEPVTIRAVANAFDELAGVSGAGSRSRRDAILSGITGRLSEGEAVWLRRLILGELRTGVQEGLVLEAIAECASVEAETVRRAHMLRGDVGEVAHLALEGGQSVLEEVGLEVGRPVRPMLAGRVEAVQEALVELGGPLVFEHKLDGARVQVHKLGDEVRVFSRRLSEVTESLPEVVRVGALLEADRAVVEGEVFAVDEEGQPRPFQELLRRFRREHGREAAVREVPVEVRLFDVLHVQGDTLIEEPLSERWARLREIAPEEVLANRVVTADPGEARGAYQAALGAGHEGLMVKDPGSSYSPGRRGSRWLKLKPETTVDCVVLGAEWGHGRRRGWLSNLHLGVRVSAAEQEHLVKPEKAASGPVVRREGFAMVGKTFKGLTDEMLASLTDRLQQIAVEEPSWGVVARPELVVEVAFDEVQTSPVYESGCALRFARVKAIREDKPVEEAASLSEVLEVREG